MRRIGLLTALLALWVSVAAAQVTSHGGMNGDNPHGSAGTPTDITSSREQFGHVCGIADTSPQHAQAFRRTPSGQWQPMETTSIPTIGDSAAARIWRQGNWMVDIHDGSGRGNPTIHTGQMCYDPQGRLRLMLDRFMEMAQCGCVRFTSVTYAEDGRITRRQQHYIKMATGAEMTEPEAAKDFPPLWEYRKLQQLPFFSLVK